MSKPGDPHMQLGQRGKGAGRRKPAGRKPQVPKPVPGPLPTDMPGTMGMPKTPPAPPSFLPNTPGWEDSRAKLSGGLYGAETQYNIGNQMIPAQLGVQTARANTDKGYAKNALLEDVSGRGISDSSDATYLYNQQVATPYGRQMQDLASGAAGQYGDLASQFGGANLDYQTQLYDSLQQRAADAYQLAPLSTPWGDYSVDDQPTFTPSYKPFGKKKPAGKKPPKKKPPKKGNNNG